MVYLNDHLEKIDVEKSLSLVSQQRQQTTLRFRHQEDRQQSLAVYLLLCKALRKEYGIIQMPLFTYGPNGKPSLHGFPHIHFNLSHCLQAALCVVDSQPVGCDVEVVPDKLDLDLCRYCCNPQEVETILSSPHPPLAFTKLWTQKEAFLKMTGEGLSVDMPSLFSSQEAGKKTIQTYSSPDFSYVFSICTIPSSSLSLTPFFCE